MGEEDIIINRIQKFYDGRSIFITGATGFVGKVLVEKLLRSCSGIDRIYMLIRTSRGKSVITRMQEFVDNQVKFLPFFLFYSYQITFLKIFDRVRETDDGFFKKLVAVEGDVTLPGFGISSDDMQLLIDNVSIVFHSAATVRFDEDLKKAIEMNVEGPRRMLHICKQMKKLQVLRFYRLDHQRSKDLCSIGNRFWSMFRRLTVPFNTTKSKNASIPI